MEKKKLQEKGQDLKATEVRRLRVKDLTGDCALCVGPGHQPRRALMISQRACAHMHVCWALFKSVQVSAEDMQPDRHSHTPMVSRPHAPPNTKYTPCMNSQLCIKKQQASCAASLSHSLTYLHKNTSLLNAPCPQASPFQTTHAHTETSTYITIHWTEMQVHTK